MHSVKDFHICSDFTVQHKDKLLCRIRRVILFHQIILSYGTRRDE